MFQAANDSFMHTVDFRHAVLKGSRGVLIILDVSNAGLSIDLCNLLFAALGSVMLVLPESNTYMATMIGGG